MIPRLTRSSGFSGECIGDRALGRLRTSADVRHQHLLIIVAWSISHSVLGTPNEDIWPGVSTLPDYKSTFPQWHPVDLERAVPALDENGIDLLTVSVAKIARIIRDHAEPDISRLSQLPTLTSHDLHRRP